MRRQRARLLELNARDKVSIQVLPFEVGAHPGLRGPFVYLEFPDADAHDVLSLEGPLLDTVIRLEEGVTSQFLETFFALERLASAPNDLEKALSTLTH